MAFYDQIQTGRAPVPPSIAPAVGQTAWAPTKGVYLTDESSLFRVVDVLSNRRELLVELEDCSTFELILCPARRLAHVGLRTVIPAV